MLHITIQSFRAVYIGKIRLQYVTYRFYCYTVQAKKWSHFLNSVAKRRCNFWLWGAVYYQKTADSSSSSSFNVGVCCSSLGHSAGCPGSSHSLWGRRYFCRVTHSGLTTGGFSLWSRCSIRIANPSNNVTEVTFRKLPMHSTQGCHLIPLTT